MVRRVYIYQKVRFCLLAGLLAFASVAVASAQGQIETPSRLRTLDDHSPFHVPASKEDWLKRKEELKDQLKLSLGLIPYPTLAPLDAQVYGDHQGDGFVVQKVVIETLPGLYLTGSLFFPSGELSAKKLPGVLCPHGHWTDGRMARSSDKDIDLLLASGAERFENAARNHIQARCIQFARMGCAAFAYDMLGNANNQQISIDRAHGYGNSSVNPTDDDSRYLLYSPQAEMYQQNMMGIQAINSVRALDFLLSLSYIDQSKIAITGASGGGTQSFITAALDDRITAAFPAVMVSAQMQGGCTCENAPYIRTGTGNVELAAMIAPRPLGMTAADDWTKNFANDGYPDLKALYQLFGVQDQVSLFQATHFPHNYNHVSRVPMYAFMNRVFELGLKEPILEHDFEYLERDTISVYDSDHPAPSGGLEFEKSLIESWQSQLDKYFKLPAINEAGKFFETTAGQDLQKGWNTITSFAEAWSKNSQVDISWPLDQPTSHLVVKNAMQQPIGSGVFTNHDAFERDRSVQAKIDWSKIQNVEIYVNGDISNHRRAEGTLGLSIQISDPLGESLSASDEQGLVDNPRPVAAYTYGYNAPSILRRTGVLLSVIDAMKANNTELAIKLVSNGSDNFIITATALRRPDVVRSLQFTEGNKFQFSDITSIRHKDFLPGALRYQDMPGLLLCASHSGITISDE